MDNKLALLNALTNQRGLPGAQSGQASAEQRIRHAAQRLQELGDSDSANALLGTLGMVAAVASPLAGPAGILPFVGGAGSVAYAQQNLRRNEDARNEIYRGLNTATPASEGSF